MDDEIHPLDRAAWREWLEEHHANRRDVWLVSWKKSTGRSSIPYGEAVEEALCFGWIDGTVNTLDDRRILSYMAPRKRGSAWARSNKERIERLERDGLIAAPGRAVIDRAKGNVPSDL